MKKYLFLINTKKIKQILLFLFIFYLFFPIRHVILSPEAFLTGNFSDFTSFSLYLSDIFIFTTCFLLILSRGKSLLSRDSLLGLLKPIPLGLVGLIIWLILGILLDFGLNTSLNAYFLIKWLELIVAYGTFIILFEEIGLKELFFRLFTWLCALQSLIALAQFTTQSSLGLYKLGESHLGSAILGVAKIVSSGTTYIRGYGTFPHPNPLSAFLVCSIIIGIYLLVESNSRRSKILNSVSIFVNILGLTVTFSRGAYLALAAGLIVYFGLLIWKKGIGFVKKPVLIVGLSILISFALFKPFLMTRATFSDQSTKDRKFYNSVGLEMAQKNPIFGVGAGESLLHMEQYSGRDLEPWEKQPPHNYFIIAAAELGIAGAMLLIWILLSHLKPLVYKLKSSHTNLLLTTILLSFLLLMQFDHYFYTLQQTQLLLWIILALVAAETKNPQEGDLQKPNI